MAIVMSSDFEKYEMVQYLKDNDNELYANVQWIYGICENLLAEIPKTFSNYTIHDIRHSIRVIGYMNELIKDHLEQFSCLHIAMLIYVGLLHDTGMIVSDAEKEELYMIFAAKEPGFADWTEENKTSYLQEYIRKNHGKRVREVLKEYIADDGTRISSRLRVGQTGAYDLTKTIADICQAHMEDTAWLEENLSGEKTYGSYKFNPRHIAVLLRIGDALDIDDRRAPYVLYNLMKIKGYSSTEWKKHSPITNYPKIFKQGDEYTIHFEGKCNDYEIFQKVDSYIDNVGAWIEKDIPLCTGIYNLNIRLPIDKKIDSDEFECTRLKFNMEYKQIVQLLMGEKLYGSKKDGLRELLQNAIDAVLLMKSIEGGSPYADYDYNPLVGIEINEKKKQIVIFDNGVGMSEHVLQKFFFNIGNSYYESKEFSNGGFSYCPIGHFGIGFLACFMLSSKIELETKHYSEKSDLIRMSFDKESQNVIRHKKNKGKFTFAHGTRIIMDYDQIIPEIFSDVNSIEEYIKELLVDRGFRFIINYNGKEKVIELTKTDRVYHYGEEKEKIEFSYSTEYNLKNLWFIHPVSDEFDDPNTTYLVNEEISTLADFDEYAEIINNIWDSSRKKVIDDLAKMNNEFLSIFVIRNYDEIKKRIDAYGEVDTDMLLSIYIKNNNLIWYTYPCFNDRQSFRGYQTKCADDGMDQALFDYRSDIIEYLSVLSKSGIPSYKEVKKVYIDYYGKQDEQCTVNGKHDIDFERIKPLKMRTSILEFGQTGQCINITQDFNVKLKIYLKGIRVLDSAITLPYSIDELKLNEIVINLTSNRYRLSVSRSNFIFDDREGIVKRIACAIFGDIKSKLRSRKEKFFIDKFLEVYYDIPLEEDYTALYNNLYEEEEDDDNYAFDEHDYDDSYEEDELPF